MYFIDMYRKEVTMKKVEEKALVFSTFTSVLLSFTLIIGVVAFISFRTKKKRDYCEKWKDYDECGV